MSVVCFDCPAPKLFSSQSSLNRHLKEIHNKVHPVCYEFNKHNSKCFECSCSFNQISDLRKHLASTHDFENEIEEYTFDNFEGFQSWLSTISAEQNIQYIRVRSRKIDGDDAASTYFYNCNRSLIAGAKRILNPDERKRQEKFQGSSKLSYLCTSQIKVIDRKNEVYIKYYKTHYQHNMEVKHLRIPKEVRSNIAGMLMEGVSETNILDQFWNESSDKNLSKRHTLTKKDINNIKASFNISNQQVRSEKKIDSIDTFVREQRRSENNCILYYKPQGADGDNILDTDDYCLILMNTFQLHMLQKFGRNITAIDSTHGISQQDFDITTIMIIDEFGEDFPVATMLTNRNDMFMYNLFFTKIKDSLGGIILVKTFLSSTTDVFFNSWNAVMCKPQQHLYCPWHIDRAWQTNLKKITNFEKRKLAYDTITSLQTIKNVDDFMERLPNVITEFKDDVATQQWGNYFEKYYGTNYKLWAMCFQKGCYINRNICLKTMEKIIKSCRSENNYDSVLKKCLHTVVNLVRNKVHERIQKKTKGENSRLIQNIHNRHSSAILQNLAVDIEEENLTFYVQSQSRTHFYEVTRLLNNPCCALQCKFCKICIHSFTCTCPDFISRTIICKHIHSVILGDCITPDENNIEEEKTDTNQSVITQAMIEVEEDNNNFESAIYSKLKEIQEKVNSSNNQNGLLQCYKYLEKANLILDAYSDASSEENFGLKRFSETQNIEMENKKAKMSITTEDIL